MTELGRRTFPALSRLLDDTSDDEDASEALDVGDWL